MFAVVIRLLSLVDRVGMVTSALISRVVKAVARNHEYEIGVHMHSNAADAAARVLAAYDAGCRRFDSAIGGLGGCPFAQDALVGNIPTESVIETLQQRGVDLEIGRASCRERV